MTVIPYLLPPAISIGSAILYYYHVSRKTYDNLEKRHGEEIESLSQPEREKFLIQKMIDRNRNDIMPLQPRFSDFRFGGYKLFAERHGINLVNLLKPDTLEEKIREYGIDLNSL
jgi:hypothetical protein